MKRILLGASVLAIAATSYADGDITVTVDGRGVKFDQPPVIDNDRTLVPMRAIFEALGATVDWDGETRTVTSKKGDIEIRLTIDTDKMTVGDKTVTLDVPAKIISDRTMVPVRAISEAMECRVDWDGEARSVIITTANTSAEETAAAQATAEPEPASEPTDASAESQFAAGIKTDIEDYTNIFDTEWMTEGKEIDAATGKEKDNEKLCATGFVPVNEGKSYYAGYYDPNEMKYKSGYCLNYAFYDADKKYISGAAADMAKTVKAPDSASYVRFTIKLSSSKSRAALYLNFMQTETVPTTFEKSDAVKAIAETDLFGEKSVFIVGDQQIQNSGTWIGALDRRLGANTVGSKGIANLRFVVNDRASLCIDKTTNTFPKNMDYMIVCAGFYDWMNSYGLGSEISSSGGIYDFLANAKIKWPNTRIVMLTIPPARYVVDGFSEGGLFNKLGMDTAEYSRQIIEACEKEKTDVIDISDLWTNNDITKYMKADNLNYLYPNEEGGELIAERIYERMVEIAK